MACVVHPRSRERRHDGGILAEAAWHRLGILVALGAGLVLSGCTEPTGGTGSSGFLAVVPEEVVALAGPNQNLGAVQFNQEDGCYWYLHEGPVEATMLPLRTAAGNPICAQRDTG